MKANFYLHKTSCPALFPPLWLGKCKIVFLLSAGGFRTVQVFVFLPEKKLHHPVYCFHRRTYNPCFFFWFFWKNLNLLYKSPACLFVSPLQYMKNVFIICVIKWCCLMPWEKIHLLPASYLNCYSVLRGLTGAFRLEKAAGRDSHPCFSCNVVAPPADEVVALHSSGLRSNCHSWLEHWLLCVWVCYNMHGCLSDSSFLSEMKQHSVKTGIYTVISLEGWLKNSTSESCGSSADLYQETSCCSSSEVAPPAAWIQQLDRSDLNSEIQPPIYRSLGRSSDCITKRLPFCDNNQEATADRRGGSFWCLFVTPQNSDFPSSLPRRGPHKSEF